jgi:hypothetical protein
VLLGYNGNTEWEESGYELITFFDVLSLKNNYRRRAEMKMAQNCSLAVEELFSGKVV